MGFLFGVAMERGKVTPPVTIRKQFLFQRFVMLKMFLAASAFGAVCFSIMSVLFSTKFDPVRSKFMSSRANNGLLPVIVGTFLLGCGMTIAGACPGMVYIQIGAGVDTAIITLLGGMAGAICFGLIHPFLSSFLSVGRLETMHKLDDLPQLRGARYWHLGMLLAAILVAATAIFEYYFHWDSESELAAVGGNEYRPWSEAWAPELSGVLIGLLQVPAVLITSGTVGSSSTFMTVVAQLLATQSLRARFAHLEAFRASPAMRRSVVYILSAALGAYVAASAGGTLGTSRGVPPGPAFVGGFLMLFGSRMAGGCTSGHGLSGMALLSLQSLAGVPAMFAGGIAAAFAYDAADHAAFVSALE